MARLLVRRIQEPGAPQEVTLACARLGLAVNLADRAWAEHAADALHVALRDPLIEQVDFHLLAEALAAVCERLPPTRAADRAARALEIFLALLRERSSMGQTFDFLSLSQAIVAISPHLDAAPTTRAAEELRTLLSQSGCTPYLWPSLSTALVSVCRRLPAPDAAAHVNRAVDFLLETGDTTKEKARSNYSCLVLALRALCGRLDPARASRVAGALVAILSDSQMVGEIKLEYISSGYVAAVLAEVAEYLDPPSVLRSTEDLVLVLCGKQTAS